MGEDKDTSSLPELQRASMLEEYNDLVGALRASGALLHEKEAASTDLEDTADGTDLSTAVTLANALKVTWAAHIADTAKHVAADTTNTISADDATDQTTLNTLVNEIKDDLNAHHESLTYHIGSRGEGGVPSSDVATADATDLATSLALVNALKAAFNRHVQCGAQLISVTGN